MRTCLRCDHFQNRLLKYINPLVIPQIFADTVTEVPLALNRCQKINYYVLSKWN